MRIAAVRVLAQRARHLHAHHTGAAMPEERPLTPDAVTELRHLRAEIAALHRLQYRASARHVWLRHVVKDLETNPHTQYRVHLWGAIYWLVNFPLVTLLFFGAPTLWVKLGLYITLIYSIYANFTTDYGSMSAAMAAFRDTPLPEIPVSPHVDVKNV
jgi:hypothetical protein